MRRILVTGGAGFIGSNLIEHFLSNGDYVVCLDNLSTGDMLNIEPFMDNINFKFIKGDIRNMYDCVRACNNIDYVFHQAALGSVTRSINDPITVNNVNVGGTLNMLIASINTKRFIYASSSSVYGTNQLQPKYEHEIGNPLSPYAITKQTVELYGKMFYKLYELETIGLRYFNVFGKNQNPNGDYAAVIPKFIGKLMNGENCEIYGDGNVSRDFTHVGNVVLANELALSATNKSIIGNVCNVACGESTSINDVYKVIRDVLSVDLKPEYKSSRKGDIMHSQASISMAEDVLGYKPIKYFTEGIKETINWYKNEQNRYN